MSIKWINQNHWKVAKDYSYTNFPCNNPHVNSSRIRVHFSVQVYSKGTAQPNTDSELIKSLRWEIIHQNEWRAWIWTRYWRLCGYAAFSQWIRWRANTAATPIKYVWRQAEEKENGYLVTRASWICLQS